MLEFLACISVSLAVTATVFVLLWRRRISYLKAMDDRHAAQLSELGRLTGELAHEIRNPLSIIKVNLKLVAEELGPAEYDGADDRSRRAARKVAVIQKETDRLQQILDGFLRYTNRGEFRPAVANVNDLVSDMIDFYSPQAQNHSITIRQALHPQPLLCSIDAGMLRQAMLNLFINAEQAMSQGGELLIRTLKHGKNAIIEIGDTGTGIARDKLPGIFDGHYSSRATGSGLGLPTAKRIVEQHNGSISVCSEVGKGTLFTIALPLSSDKD